MPEDKDSNFFFSFKDMVWSIFLGVVSFQILAPTVWDYINKLLGINYLLSYRLFFAFYIFFIPFLLLVWLAKGIPFFKQLPFFRNSDFIKFNDKYPFCDQILLLMAIGAIALSVISIIVAYTPLTSNKGFFIGLAIICLVFCVVLIHYTSMSLDVFSTRNDNCEPITANYLKTTKLLLKKEMYSRRLKLKIFPFAFLIIFSFVFYCLLKNSDEMKENNKIVDSGFRLLELRDSINKQQKQLSDISNTQKRIELADSLINFNNDKNKATFSNLNYGVTQIDSLLQFDIISRIAIATYDNDRAFTKNIDNLIKKCVCRSPFASKTFADRQILRKD